MLFAFPPGIDNVQSSEDTSMRPCTSEIDRPTTQLVTNVMSLLSDLVETATFVHSSKKNYKKLLFYRRLKVKKTFKALQNISIQTISKK